MEIQRKNQEWLINFWIKLKKKKILNLTNPLWYSSLDHSNRSKAF